MNIYRVTVGGRYNGMIYDYGKNKSAWYMPNGTIRHGWTPEMVAGKGYTVSKVEYRNTEFMSKLKNVLRYSPCVRRMKHEAGYEFHFQVFSFFGDEGVVIGYGATGDEARRNLLNNPNFQEWYKQKKIEAEQLVGGNQ